MRLNLDVASSQQRDVSKLVMLRCTRLGARSPAPYIAGPLALSPGTTGRPIGPFATIPPQVETAFNPWRAIFAGGPEKRPQFED